MTVVSQTGLVLHMLHHHQKKKNLLKAIKKLACPLFTLLPIIDCICTTYIYSNKLWELFRHYFDCIISHWNASQISLGDWIDPEPNFENFCICIGFSIQILGIQINGRNEIDYIVSDFNRKVQKEIENDWLWSKEVQFNQKVDYKLTFWSFYWKVVKFIRNRDWKWSNLIKKR